MLPSQLKKKNKKDNNGGKKRTFRELEVGYTQAMHKSEKQHSNLIYLDL